MMPDFISSVLIEPVALSCGVHFLLLNARDFDQAAEAAKERRVFQVEVKQNIIVGQFYGLMAQNDRSDAGQFILDAAMGDEIHGGTGPQEVVETLDDVQIRRVDHHLVAHLHRFCGEPAGDGQSVSPTGIKVNLRHSWLFRDALSIRNCVSSGTGRPVAPFSLPDFHAVPAISRCAQRYFLVKRQRKQAAVMVPAGRPPILATSAKLLLSCSWYSSHNGKRHAGSPAWSAAPSNSSASSSSGLSRPEATWPRAI